MKDRSRPIYQPWSEADLNMDEDYQSLGYIEKWMYRTLCQKAFVCSTRPYLPDDDSVLWKLSGSPSRAYWDEHKKTVRGMFRAFAAEGTTVLSRTRLVEDWERIQRIRRVKSFNASGGGRQEQAEQSTSNGCATDAVHPHTAAYDRSQVSKEVSKEKPKATSGAKTAPVPSNYVEIVKNLAKAKTLTKEQASFGKVKSISNQVLWLLGHGWQDNADLKEEVKRWCSQNGIDYSPDEIRRALDVGSGKAKSA